MIRIEKESILHTDACYTAQTLVKLMIDYNVKIRNLSMDDADSAQRFLDTVAIFKLLTHNITRQYLPLLLLKCVLIKIFVDMRELVLIRPSTNIQIQSYENALICILHLIHLLLETADSESRKGLVKNLVRNLVALNPTTVTLEDSLLHLSVSGLTALPGSYLSLSEGVRG